MVRQRSAKPLFPSSNLGSTSTSSRTALVRDDFFMLCIKSHLSPASSLLLSEMQTLRWFAFRFLFFGLIHSVQLTHVAADCILFAATFYASHEKSLLTYSVAAPLKIVTALLGHDFVFLIWKLIHSVRMTQVNETRFSNSFIEKRVSSCIQSLEKSRLFFLSAELMRIKTLRI